MLSYRVWVDGRERETERVIKVSRYPDGALPTPMRIRDTACKTIFFGFRDYTRLKYERVIDPVKSEGSRKGRRGR